MRRVVCPSVALLWGLISCFGYAAKNETKLPNGKSLHIKVRAVDTLGKPIAGALIETWQSGGDGGPYWVTRRKSVNDGKEVRTADDGWASLSFVLPPDPPTRRGPRIGFCLTAQAKGFLVTRCGRIDPVASDHYEVVFTLRRLVSVEGHVVDQQGRPVAAATVFHTGNATPRTEVKTDAQGHFRLDGLPEGKPSIFVTHPAYHFHGQLVDTSAEPRESTPTIKLLPADQTPPPLRTLPPLRSHEEEMKTARRVLRPLWQAAVKSAPEGERGWDSEWYARIEPWVAYDYVNTHLTKQAKGHFVSWQMPRLYAADPEEALAVLESLDALEYMKAFALLNTVRETPGLSGRQKLELLNRAAQHARAATDPDERVHRLSAVAVRLFELGKTEEAKKIVDFVTPTAKQLSPKHNSAAVATAGQALSLFDLPAGLRLLRSTRGEGDDYYWLPALLDVACRIAKQKPDEAARIAAEAVDFAKRSYPDYHRKEYNRDPSEEESIMTASSYENRLVPLCYALVSVDAARAERLAATIHNPYSRAYALGMIVKALAPSDKTKARKLIVQAYDILTEASRHPDRRWPQLSWSGSSLPATAVGLLPVVEEIDPTLVRECLWRAVSFRLNRPADAYLVWLEPESNDEVLAAFVARYDRPLARALSPQVQRTVVPNPDWLDTGYMPLVMIDANEAIEKFQADTASHGADAGLLQATFFLDEFVPIDSLHRWDRLASQMGLWIPDNQYSED